ncbi:hypothetical protein [Helicobacter sp. 23-1045]
MGSLGRFCDSHENRKSNKKIQKSQNLRQKTIKILRIYGESQNLMQKIRHCELFFKEIKRDLNINISKKWRLNCLGA